MSEQQEIVADILGGLCKSPELAADITAYSRAYPRETVEGKRRRKVWSQIVSGLMEVEKHRGAK